MKVLLVTFSFPPAGGVGVLRALSLAKYLPEHGIRVDVLTARNSPAVGADLSLLRQVPESVTVHRRWTLDLPFALRKAVKRRLTRQAAPSAPAPGGEAGTTLAGRLKRLLGNALLPDPQIGWLPFAVPAARSIVRKRHIDLAIVTVPPFSTSLMVPKLRAAFPDLPIVLDFRDEWLTTTMNLWSFDSNPRARLVAASAEAAAVQAATAVVLVTEAARKELIGRYPGVDASRFLCIPNGFDRTPGAPAALRRPSGTVTLTYIGSVYASTAPETFVEAVLALPDALRSRLRLRFIGHIETRSYRESLLRLGPQVELLGFMPQAQALQSIETTDFLLLITHDPINVAAKFYDYLAGGKPIVAAIHPDGDVRRLLDETHAGRWADVRDPGAIQTMLATLLEQDAAAFPSTDPSRVAAYHRRALTARYAELCKHLVQPTP